MGAKRHVMIELAQTAVMEAVMGGSPRLTFQARLEPIAGLSLDQKFKVELSAPGPSATANVAEMPTVLLRGQIEEELLDKDYSSLNNVLGIYADPVIEAFPTTTCSGSPAIGDSAAVKKLLDLEALHSAGHTGRNVLVAIVDTGINLAHLRSRGLSPKIDVDLSWAVDSAPSIRPGQAPVGHGTMCAFDALIGSPTVPCWTSHYCARWISKRC